MTDRRTTRWPLFRSLSSIILVAGLSTVAAVPAHAQDDVTDVLLEAEDLMAEGSFTDAVKLLRKTARSNPDDFELQVTLGRAYNGAGAFKNGVTAAKAAITLAIDDPQRALAHNNLGIALFAQGEGDTADFPAAAQAFEKVLEISGGQANSARASLAEILLQLEQDERAVALLKEYLEVDPQAPRARRARSLIENPLRARVALAPEFDVATLDGEFLALEDLAGKVVLLDFWGTWCGPCHDAVPGLRDISRRRSKAPFEMISISNDSDEQKLRAFIKDNRMDWPQVWDRQREIIADYQVGSYPSYLIISHEGIIVYRSSGWSTSKDVEVRNEVNRAIREARKAEKSARN